MDLCLNVAYLSALQALAEPMRMMRGMGCVLHTGAAQSHRWKHLQTKWQVLSCVDGYLLCPVPSLPSFLHGFSHV